MLQIEHHQKSEVVLKFDDMNFWQLTWTNIDLKLKGLLHPLLKQDL
jgi:hypothetical protein